MSFGGPNLARQPFVNARPARRVGAALWVAALALLAWNALAYQRSGTGVAGKAAELERLRAETDRAQARAETLETDLRRADLERANQRTDYLNRRIAERAFSWNLLLDRLIETMPRGVRLVRLAPEGFRDERAGRGKESTAAPVDRKVALQIEGESEDDESMLEFVDRLFAHPAFDRPNLSREARTKSGGLGFSISVAYRPAAELAPPAPDAAAGGEPVPVAATAARAVAPAGVATGSPAAAEHAAGPLAAAPTAVPGAAPGAPATGREPAAARAARPVASADGAPAQAPAGAAAAPEAAARPAAAPRTSIFGGPVLARPYASGGSS